MRARPSDQALVPAASSPAVSTKGFDPSRKEKWAAFDAGIARRQHLDAAPYFIEGAEGGLWHIQYLYRRSAPHYGPLWRLLFNPPQLKSIEHEAYYNGWPGDRRGWMMFATKQDALDFFKFETGRISFDDYRARARPPRGPYERYDMNEEGDAIATEAGTAETENTGSVHEGAGRQASPKEPS